MPRRRKPRVEAPPPSASYMLPSAAPELPLPSQPSQVLPRLLTCQDLADLLRTSRKAIELMKRRGLLPEPINIGNRRLLWRESDVASWLNRRSRDQGVRS